MFINYNVTWPLVNLYFTHPYRNKPFNVKYLLEQGASVDAINGHGGTSFYIAACGGFTKCAEYLLQHGADVNLKVRHHGFLNKSLSVYRVIVYKESYEP